jgi:methyl-accepting chemotaxis protein
MNLIVSNSLIMFGLLATAIILVMVLVRLVLGKGIVLTFALITIIIIAIDVELGFILGQIGLSLFNAVVTFSPGVILTLVLIFILYRIIVVPIRKITETTRRLSVGDLHGEVNYKNDNEIGQLADSLGMVIAYQRDIARLANQVASGELHENAVVKSDQDELGHAFQKMIQQLNHAIGQVSENASNVHQSSQQLASSAAHAGQSASQISKTIHQVAEGIDQQSRSMGNTASSADQMGRAINSVARGAQEQASAVAKASEITLRINNAAVQVAGNARAVTERSAEAAEAARNGYKTVEETLNGMVNIRAKVGASAEKVQDMGSRSNQIGAIVETIEDIASQTNLLALNAAIEAARAGEHGKGFAVVADEVRKLAERSSTATKEIGSLIKTIQKTVSEAVQAMKEGANEVELGVTSANRAGQALNNILEAAEAVYKQAQEAGQTAESMRDASNELVGAIDSVSTVVEENTAATEEMSAGSNEVTQAIESIASVSQQNNAAISEVNYNVAEVGSQVQQVSVAAQSLTLLANDLAALANQFRIK